MTTTIATTMARSAAVAAQLLADKTRLPEPAIVRLYAIDDDFNAQVEMQLRTSVSVAEWAREFGVPIRVERYETYLRISANFAADEVSVQAWKLIDLATLPALDMPEGEPVDMAWPEVRALLGGAA